jgi:hypothetical protein
MPVENLPLRARRNLSAYNYFFAATRRDLLDNRLRDQMRGIEPVQIPARSGSVFWHIPWPPNG